MKLTGTTFGELLRPAMAVQTQAEADEYLSALVDRMLELDPDRTREAVLEIAKSNIGYWTGYYDHATAERVFRLFRTKHPVFGTEWPTMEEAFNAGKRLGEEYNRSKSIGRSTELKGEVL